MLKNSIIFLIILIPLIIVGQDKKVLFLGNSYTNVNDLPALFKSLSSAGGFEISVDKSTPGGCTLSNPSNGHLFNAQSIAKIHAENWDYVILQEQSQYPVIPYWRDNYFYPGAKSLDSIIKENNRCTKTMFFMTWGRKFGGQQCIDGHCSIEFSDFNHMMDSMASSYLGNAKEINAQVSPVGMAWKNALAEDNSIELFSSDGSHPSLAGSYLAACTFYASIFHESPVGLEFYSTLDESTATFLQQIASNTVFNNLDFWNIDTTLVSAIYEYEITELTVDFSNYSTNANAYIWQYGDGTSDTVKNPLHTYEHTGLYNTELIAYRTCDTSSVSQFINIETLSISDEDMARQRFSVYGNPSTNIIVIRNILLNGTFNISIADIYGNTLFQDLKSFKQGEKFEIKLEDINTAIHFVRISNEDFSLTKKILLNNGSIN